MTTESRFEIEEVPYDDDTTEMVCRDLLLGESFECRPYQGCHQAVADWIEGQKTKSQTRAA